ncbi:hypothetical protein JTE90_024035 [Oedothorax gibbosus]|uniref:SH3 domain-containing protein n=1 Tax=Oedothorax gibbosus TaxID=931172 RepID=A0AAV6VB20_9ARAC|nr:hypothetical protein JTE90_024035 [Oedothorax gibbosus]
MSDGDVFIYVALYDLSSGHKQVLLFKKDDVFIPVPSCSSNPNWAVCVDTKGNAGYVPYTYVEKKTVNIEEFIWMIEDALGKLHVDSPTSTSKLTRDVIQSLTLRRSELLNAAEQPSEKIKDDVRENVPNNHVPETVVPQEVLHFDDISDRNSLSECETNEEASVILNHEASTNHLLETAQTATQTDSISDYNVPKWLVPSLVENVRHKTKISHENSKAAVGIVLDTFLDAIPQLDFLWLQLKSSLKKSEIAQEDIHDSVYSEDQTKLLDIFKQLWYAKNDEQQRSWPVHEDEDLIIGLLVELNNILLDANPRVTREMVRRDEYEMVELLVTYYQMEPRKTLRIKMLHVLLTLCELDSVVITQLLNSVLPMELARDIQDNFEDNEKTLHSSLLLSVIFCTGERPPLGTYAFISNAFLHFLFDKLEEVVKEGDEDLGQNLLSIVLAFNLHFQNTQDNIVLATLKEMQSAQVLTEKLVLLLNREEDPCRILIDNESTPNSVMKFMVDLFSSPQLIDLFYLNDIKVLLDIIVRQLTDLLPGEKKRLYYLCLVRNLLMNSTYSEHMHQSDSLKQCFKNVVNQEFPEKSEVDIVLEITNQYSWFKDI